MKKIVTISVKIIISTRRTRIQSFPASRQQREAESALEAIEIAEAEEGNPPREAAATVRKAMYKEWNCDNHDVFTGACLNTKAGV